MTKTPFTAVLLAAGFALAAAPAFGQDSGASGADTGSSVVVPLKSATSQPADEQSAQDGSSEDQAAEASGADEVVATVNGKEINQSDLIAFIQQLPPQLQSQVQLLMPQILDQLVNNALASEAGRGAGLAQDAEVRQRLSKIEDLIIGQTFLQRAIEEKITDERIEEAYQAFVEDNPPQRQLQARHILVETEEEAQDVIAALDDGADFAELAKERSTGPSGANGGALPPFQAGEMVPEFSDAAFAMEVGSYSKEPVKTQFGYHVIIVEDSTMNEPPAREAMEPQLRDQLSQDAVEEIYAELRDGAEIDILFGRPQADDAAPDEPAAGESPEEPSTGGN